MGQYHPPPPSTTNMANNNLIMLNEVELYALIGSVVKETVQRELSKYVLNEMALSLSDYGQRIFAKFSKEGIPTNTNICSGCVGFQKSIKQITYALVDTSS